MHLWIVGARGKIENGERKRGNDLIKRIIYGRRQEGD